MGSEMCIRDRSWHVWVSTSMHGMVRHHFGWPAGYKLPAGCQLLDGSHVPHGAEPQPDGTVLLLDGSRISASEVILPDGANLTDVTQARGKSATVVATMPDGSSTCHQGAWWWCWYIWGYTTMPGVVVPAFGWPLGLQLPAGAQLPDGTRVPSGAVPQPNGAVLLVSGATVPSDLSLIHISEPTRPY